MILPSPLNLSDDAMEPSVGTFNFPASFAQRRLWFLDQLAPGDVSYNIAGAVQIEGTLETTALEKSVQEIVRRHESLRTRFESDGGEPQQVIDSEATLFLQRLDLRSVAEEERWLKADQLMREESQQPFDLRRGPLLRAKLIQLADQEHTLLVTMHHIVSDGWSVGILVAELAELYTAFREGRPFTLPELPIQYADYSAWQQEQLSGESLKSLVDYWKSQLESHPCGLDVVTDRPHRQNRSTSGAQHNFRLEPGLLRRLQQLGQKHGATLYMVLLAAFQTLLFRYSGQTDILVGSPIAGRTRKETQGLIGCFVNTLVMRARFTNNLTFRELLKSVKDTTLEAYAHQDLPFEKLVEDLSPQRSLGRSPFFQAMFVLQNAPMPELQLGSAILRLIDIQSETAKFELTLTLVESESGLAGNIEYSTDLFDPPTIVRLAEHFSFLLKGLVSEPGRPVSLVPLVSIQEILRLQSAWAGPTPTNVEDRDILALLQSHADDQAKIAIVSKGRTLTYAELDRCAEEWAMRFGVWGIKPGMRVGLCFKDGVKGVIALIAVLKADGVGVPLDTDLPVSRIEYILKDAGAQWAVSDEECSERIQQAGIQVFSVHDDEEPSPVTQALNEHGAVRRDGEALVLYQSDPSGKPKGVLVWYSALLPRAFAGLDTVIQTDHVAQSVTLGSMENQLVELLRAFAMGATIIDVAEEKTPHRLATVLREQEVTVLVTRGAELARLAAEFAWALETVRIILLNESSGITLERLQRSLNPILLETTYQTYGSNETNGWWGLRSMGAGTHGLTDTLAAGVTLKLLDNHDNPVPEHIAGEICIGINKMLSHRGLAVSDYSACKSNAGLYRSGEFAWRRPDGSLNPCGRRDGRGWVSGVRVEPREIEIILKTDANIQDAGVLVGVDSVRAFIVAGHREAVDFMAIKQRLEDRLPTMMVPQRIDLTETIPKLPDGTVNRAAIQALADSVDSSTNVATEYAAPRNDIERTLVAIWEKTLGLNRVGIHDDFFRIGGHSLLATQVIARISEELGASIPLRQLFEAPTIARFGEIVSSFSQTGETLAPIRRVARVPVGAGSLPK